MLRATNPARSGSPSEFMRSRNSTIRFPAGVSGSAETSRNAPAGLCAQQGADSERITRSPARWFIVWLALMLMAPYNARLPRVVSDSSLLAEGRAGVAHHGAVSSPSSVRHRHVVRVLRSHRHSPRQQILEPR